MATRIIGIDLAVTAAHKAVVLDQTSNCYVSKLVSFNNRPAEMDHLLQLARQGSRPNVKIVAVLEATGMAWLPVATFLDRHGVEVFRVNGRQTADQRRVFHRHAKSDQIDARVLARLYLTLPERLQRLHIPSDAHLTLQRSCRELTRLTQHATAIKNRLSSLDNYAWLGLIDVVPSNASLGRWIRCHWFNPWRVIAAGPDAIWLSWADLALRSVPDDRWATCLVRGAQQVVDFYGDPPPVDYDALQLTAQRELNRLFDLETEIHHLRMSIIRPLYRQLHPTRHLETIPGIGQDSAAIYLAFIADIQRFPSLNQFRGWSGMIPFSSQSGTSQARGLHITQAGPDLIKATAFLNAGIARRYDPQIAAIYHDQIMVKGKHHLQAICACATHLLNRVYALLRDDRPYVLADIDGTPVDKKTARTICQQRYLVSATVRAHNNCRVRTQRAEQRVEQRYLRQNKKTEAKVSPDS